MLIAEIRRKLASLDELDADDPESLDQLRGLLRESQEDLLTADVFGALKYLPGRNSKRTCSRWSSAFGRTTRLRMDCPTVRPSRTCSSRTSDRSSCSRPS